jgi:hypothetical protein
MFKIPNRYGRAQYTVLVIQYNFWEKRFLERKEKFDCFDPPTKSPGAEVLYKLHSIQKE